MNWKIWGSWQITYLTKISQTRLTITALARIYFNLCFRFRIWYLNFITQFAGFFCYRYVLSYLEYYLIIIILILRWPILLIQLFTMSLRRDKLAWLKLVFQGKGLIHRYFLISYYHIFFFTIIRFLVGILSRVIRFCGFSSSSSSSSSDVLFCCSYWSFVSDTIEVIIYPAHTT